MTSLIIQIPCFNEAETLPRTLADLPKSLPGIARIETLIVDDGSTDGTARVAEDLGVDHVVRLHANRGLATAFRTGLEHALKQGADIVVNTDGDNQYCGADIARLIAPILDRKADIVIGARPIDDIAHFSPLKKRLQHLGSWAVRQASGVDIPDAPSGFRAFSREAALELMVFSGYTYTLETIIQAGQKGIAMTAVPVRVNPVARPSRLMKSTLSYVLRSALVIMRIFLIYRPLRFFTALGLIPFTAGFLLGVRWLILFVGGTDRSHVPSLVLAAILIIIGVQTMAIGLIGDVTAANRRILEEIRTRLRRREYDAAADGADTRSGEPVPAKPRKPRRDGRSPAHRDGPSITPPPG